LSRHSAAEGAQVVRRAGVDCAGVADNADRPAAGSLVGRNRRAQPLHIDRVVGSNGDATQRIVAEAEQLDCLADGGMRFGGGVHRQ